MCVPVLGAARLEAGVLDVAERDGSVAQQRGAVLGRIRRIGLGGDAEGLSLASLLMVHQTSPSAERNPSSVSLAGYMRTRAEPRAQLSGAPPV